MRPTIQTMMLSFGMVLAVGCGNTDIFAESGGPDGDALDESGANTQTSCELIEDTETCDAREDCHWVSVELESYPPQYIDACFSLEDSGDSDPICGVVSSDGTVEEVPCEEPGDEPGGTTPSDPGDTEPGDTDPGDTEPGDPGDEPQPPIHEITCEEIQDVEICEALEGCHWVSLQLESYPPQYIEECRSDENPDTGDDCSVVSSDGTVTWFPCDDGSGDGSVEPGEPGTGGGSEPGDPGADG